MKPLYKLGCTGHIDLSRIKDFKESQVRTRVREYIEELREKYDVTFYSELADGADMLFTDIALNCGCSLVAVLPKELKEYRKEHEDNGIVLMEYIERASKVEVIKGKDNNNEYLPAGQYIIDNCDELLAIWDEKKLPFKDEKGNDINLGGTYHLILLAEEKDKKIKLFS